MLNSTNFGLRPRRAIVLEAGADRFDKSIHRLVRHITVIVSAIAALGVIALGFRPTGDAMLAEADLQAPQRLLASARQADVSMLPLFLQFRAGGLPESRRHGSASRNPE
jgi:hypothetical protein